MILWNSGLSSAEILERQKMFKELIQNGNYLDIHEAIENAGTLELTLLTIIDAIKEGINKSLNPFNEKEDPKKQNKPKEDESTYFSSRDLQAAITFLRIQQKLLGNNPIFMNLFESLTSFSNAFEIKNKNLNEEATDNILDSKLLTSEEKSSFEQYVKQLKTINKLLPAVSLKDINFESIKDELMILEEHKRGKAKPDEEKKKALSGMFWMIGKLGDLIAGGLPYASRKIFNDLEKTQELVAKLNATDSVHLHQSANLLEQEIIKNRAILKGEVSQESEVMQEALPSTSELSQFNHLDRKSSSIYDLIGIKTAETKRTPFNETLKQLDALCLFAGMIQNEKLAPVSFNETGEIKLSNMFSIFKRKEDEVKNTVVIDASEERVQLLTGPNGSGKTFHEKSTVASLLMSLATGYAPCENASIPVLDSVIYLDKVVKKQDSELSAFSQEIEYWKKLLPLLESKKAVFTAVDEAFSSTSPVYQAAFTYASISEFLKNGHFLMLATHNHDLVTKLQNIKTQLVNPYHFQFSIENGKMNYKYSIREGHENSYATEVARMMNFPEEILS